MLDEPISLHPARLQLAHPSDVDEFVESLAAFERGELTADDWRTFRRLRGVYDQRQDGRAMIRVKVPGGAITAAQLRTVAEVAERHAGGLAHITTRQCFQLHFVPTPEVDTALAALAAAGLTTREACGNSVRNVTTCPLAGVGLDEPFDVSPYLDAIVHHFLRGPWSSKLPRKLKPSIGGCCGGDCSQAFINDLGLLATTRDGAPGFRLVAGGGLGTLRRSAIAIDEFVPAAELLAATEAVVRVFHHHGNRENRAKARLKWVIEKLGADAVRGFYREQRELIAAEGGRPYTPRVIPTPAPRPRLPIASVPADGFAAWAAEAVSPQRQAGFAVARVRVPLGDLSSAQLRALAAIVELHSEGELRTTNDQDLAIRWIPDDRVPLVHRALVDAGLTRTGAGSIVDVTSCPGATSCQLAVTTSRGAARSIGAALELDAATLAAAPDLTIKISGCPNSCGQHHIAAIGLQGGVRKLGGRAVPQYLVHVGGAITGDGARFGRLVAKIPARRLPEAVAGLAALVARERRDGEPGADVLARASDDALAAVLGPLGELSVADATEDDYVDLDDGDPRHAAA